MRYPHTLTAIGVILTTGCVDSTSSATLAPSNASHVVSFTAAPRFLERSREQKTGQRTKNGGCVFELPLHLQPGEHAVQRIAQIDTLTCSYMVARGDWTSRDTSYRTSAAAMTRGTNGSSLALTQSSTSDRIVGADGPPSLVANEPPVTATTSPRLRNPESAASGLPLAHAWMDVAVYDPVNIRLTDLQNWLDWNYWANCAQHGNGRHAWDAHTSTGWLYGPHSHSWTGYNCMKLGDYASNSFFDPYFCALVTTYVWLDNEVDGLGDGGADFRPRITWTGGCTFFLNQYVDYDNWTTV